MKKKILLVLLVVLMVGILAFSVFACNNDDDSGKKPSKNPAVDNGDDDGDDEGTDYLTPMLQDVVGAIDNTIKGVTDIEDAASVSASIFVNVEVDGESYNVALDIAGSIDKENANKNWAQIDANVLGVEVSLFAVNNGEVEDLYIAQNILNEQKKWSKLSQFEEADALSNLACNGIIDAVAKLLDNEDENTGATVEQQINGGILNSLAGGMLGAVGAIGGSLFVPGEGAANDFTTADGYAAGINVEGISSLLKGLGSMLSSLPAEYHGIIETAVGILLGGELDLSAGTFEPGAEDKTPTIELAFGVKDDLFTGLEISYALPDLSVEFGINNLSLKGTSASYKAPFSGTPEELAIALSLDLVAPGISADAMNAQVNIYPNVAMSFDNEGYVALDLSGLYAYATANINGNDYTIAEYNVNADYPDDIILNLEPLFAEASAYYAMGGYDMSDMPFLYRIPVDLQSKFDKMIADEKAKKNTSSNAAQNAINGKNVVDYVLDDIVPSLFNEDGSFNIGGVVGVLGQVGAIVEEIKPILETEGLFDTAIVGSTASATLNLEVLMDALLNDSDIITGITGEWNSFNLYKYVTTVEGEGEDAVETTAVEYVKGLTLAELLGGADVVENIVAFVNTAVYENNKAEGQEYADFYMSMDELTVSDVNATLANWLGIELNAENAYDDLAVSVGGYAQKGIGFSIGVSVADVVADIQIGASIITNEAKSTYTPDEALAWTGDKNYYAGQYGRSGFVVDYSKKYSNNTGNDGAALLLECLKALVKDIDNGGIITRYVDVADVGVEGTENVPTLVGKGNLTIVGTGAEQYYYVETGFLGGVELTWDAENVQVKYFPAGAWMAQPYVSGTELTGLSGFKFIVVAEAGAEATIAVDVLDGPAGTEDDPYRVQPGQVTLENGKYYEVVNYYYDAYGDDTMTYEANVYTDNATIYVVEGGVKTAIVDETYVIPAAGSVLIYVEIADGGTAMFS